ncbi:MFS transporter [Streptomyces sp. R302]|uniref:MFS transporter n=1 Tax=unclassified Streptomyces TaxID=2593676 RepID=UPI00145E1DE8|nr:MULTISPECIES: MFS transporter [unclassified Streptomyces]NML48819.1 MFS transporter [Streptomyces sp. R301]NML77146.1 MFS transporter [Streptomyces sp. R302]
MSAEQRDRRPLFAVLSANAISISGNSLTLIGVPWFTLETTGSAGKAGLVAFCAAVPVVVSAIAGGPVIDRIGRRRVSVASDLICALALAAIPLLSQAGLLRFWMLCALMAVTGLFHAPGETSRHVLVPELARRAGTPLSRAASLYDAVSRGARMTGAAVGGLLVAVIGADTVLYADAGTFLLSALLALVGLRGVPAAEPLRNAPALNLAVYRTDLREGYSFLLRTRLLLAVDLMVMVTNGLALSWSAVLLPIHAREELGGSAAQGLLVAVFGGSALIGALLHGAVGHRFPRRPVFTVGFLISAAPILTAAFTHTVAPMVVAAVFGGLGAGVLNPILTTAFYEVVPEELRSRVGGASTAAVLLVTPLGGLAAGFLVERVGITGALLTVGGAFVLATLSPLFFPVWRELDAPVEPPGGAGETADAGRTAPGAGTGPSSAGPATPASAPAPAASPPRR